MRRRPLYRQFVSSYHCVALPPSSPSRRRRVIGARRASLSSQRLLVSLHGVGTVSGFWEVLSQLLAEHLLPSTPVFAGLHRRSTSSNFCTISNADNPIVRMSNTFFVVRSHIASVTSTRKLGFASVRSASVFD